MNQEKFELVLDTHKKLAIIRPWHGCGLLSIELDYLILLSKDSRTLIFKIESTFFQTTMSSIVQKKMFVLLAGGVLYFGVILLGLTISTRV